jgi:hypothetical protein
MKKSEHNLQSACVSWFRIQYPKFAGLLFAIPNGGSRTAAGGRALKREGVLPGVPDLFLAVPSGGLCGLFIELKTESGRLTRAQSEFLERARLQGYRAVVVRSVSEFMDTVIRYLGSYTADPPTCQVLYTK